jgi:O-antigen/teichoic acid export membrane protein
MAAQLGIKLLSFGFSVLIVRQLGVQDYGQYAAVLAFSAMFAIVGDLGLSPYAVRRIAQWRDMPDGVQRADELYGNVLLLRLLLALLASALMIAAAWLTGRPPVMLGAIAFSTLGTLLYAVQGTSDAVLAGFERLDLSAAARVLNQLVFVLAGGVVLWLGLGYYGLILANLLGVALMAAICWRSARGLGVRPARAAARNWPALLRASLPFGMIGFALGLSYKFDSVLLNVFRGDLETGYYNAAYNLVFSTVMLSNVINTSLYPSLARRAVGAPHELPAIYERVLRYLLVLALPIALGTWVLADQIVPFLFRAQYLPAVAALRIVIWVVPLMFASEFLGYVIVIAGNERRVARALIVSTALNIVVNLILVPRFGFRAAAVMTVATEAVLVGQYLWLLRGLVGQFSWRSLLARPLLAAVGMGAVVALPLGLPLLLNVGLGALAYAVLLLALGVVGRDELSFIRNLRRPAVGGEMLP